MGFEIVRSDITKIRADAIVNTADPEPIVGAGTDFAVHAAAGSSLLEARKEIGAIAVGESAATPAFNLPAKYVLHTVSPVWQGGTHGETALLYRAYMSALTLAKTLGCRSAAFPLMAAGSLGFPQEIALKTAIRAFTDFLLENEMTVILAVFGHTAYALAGSLFVGVKRYIDDRAADEAEQAEYRNECRDRRRMREANVFSAGAPKETDEASDFSLCDELPFASVIPAAMPMHAAPKMQALSLEDLLKQTESTFSEHLNSLLNECGEKDSAVYRRAQISRQLFSKIIGNRDYQPTKSTAIQLALALKLDLAATQTLLKKAGYSLTRSSKADLVVQYFIERREFNVLTINAALFDCGLPLLKTGSAS